MAKTTIIDERTGKPIEYEALYQEALQWSRSEEVDIVFACQLIANKANSDKSDSIERQLRRLRSNDTRSLPVSSLEQPIWGFGTFVYDLQQYAKQLEAEYLRIAENQEFAAHRMKQIAARAQALEEFAERRLKYLESLNRDQVIEALRPHLCGLEKWDSIMDPEMFLDREKRALEVISMTSGRTRDGATRALDFL